ncbi:MAG: pentapeptide repeat-containing protein [Cyanobacteria bacterium P01_D01_bin.44]
MTQRPVYPHLSIHRLEKRLQVIPTWLVALIAFLILSSLIIFIRAEEANLPSLEATLTAPKQVMKLLIEDAEAIALVVAVILYVKGAPDRKAQKHYEAWRVIDTAAAANVTTSYARYQALLDLHQDGVSLQWLEAPNANLSNITLPRADLRECNLQGANLQHANLRGANFQGADLTGANLSHANLMGSNLTAADLREANLRGAVLWKAQLWETDLAYAELRWADLHREQLEGANLHATILPDGSVHTTGTHAFTDPSDPRFLE